MPKRSALSKIPFAILLFVTLSITGCATIDVTAPARVSFDQPIQNQNLSKVLIKNSVSTKDVNDLLRSQIQNPVLDGEFDVVGTITAIETVTDKELVKLVITPYTPGYWKSVTKKTYRTVRESFSCALKPWRWGTCWRDVTKAVWSTTKVYVEPQLEVAKWVVRSVVKVFNRVFKTNIIVRYPTDLTKIDVRFIGNRFEVKTEFRTNLKFDYNQAIIPLGPTLELKSLLKAPVRSQVVVAGDMIIEEPGRISVRIDSESSEFKFLGDISPDLPVLEGEDLDRLLFPVLKNVLQPLIEKHASKAVYKAITEELDQNADDLNFREQINDLSSSIGEPKRLAENIWLNVRPKRIVSGQISGTPKRIYYMAGLEFRPVIEYTPKVPEVEPAQIPFVVDDNLQTESFIDLKFQVKLDHVAREIKKSLNDVIKEEGSIRKIVRVDDVELFKTTDDKLAVKIRIERKRFFGIWTFFANAFFTTMLNYDDATGYFSLQDVEFSAETKSAFLDTILNFLVAESVEQEIEEEAKYSAADEARIAKTEIKNLTVPTKRGEFRLRFNDVEISNPYVTEENLEANATFTGKITFDYTLEGQNALLSKSFSSEELILAADDSDRISLEKSRDILTASNNSGLYRDYDYIDFVRNSSLAATTTNFPTELKVGDPLLIEKDGQIFMKQLGPEDLPTSDEIIVYSPDSPGDLFLTRVRKIDDKTFSIVSVNGAKRDPVGVLSTNIPTVSVAELDKYIDQEVVVAGVVSCVRVFTAGSGEKIVNLGLDGFDCVNDTFSIKVYKGTVSIPIEEDDIGKKIRIESYVDFEAGKPTIKVKADEQLKIEPFVTRSGNLYHLDLESLNSMSMHR